MGKKSKKTTWRNLPIEDQQQQCSSVTISDSDSSSHITISSCHSMTSAAVIYQPRHHDSSARGSGPVAYSPRCSRYDPAAAMARYNHSCGGNGSLRPDRKSEGRYGGVHRPSGGSKAAGDGGGGKITFNEDEYTKITTPRQDVLFKKGYLNRPRPSLAATTPPSTIHRSDMDAAVADNPLFTPDHQLMSPDSPFCYPTAGYIARDGLYFFNGFESYPVVVYNAAPPQYCYSTADLLPSSRSKRYSTDSMTESTTSPQTEEHSGGDGDIPSFLPSLQTTATQQAPNCTRKSQTTPNTNQEPIDLSGPLNGNVEQRKLKKKRRRKVSSKLINKKPDESTTTSVSVSEDEFTSDDTEDLEGEETTPHINVAEESPSTCPNSPQSGSSSPSSSIATNSSRADHPSQGSAAPSQLKPDAKEFIPRIHCNDGDSLAVATPPLDHFAQTQYQLIDQLGRPLLQPTFMPLPFLLSPLDSYMMPPPYTALLNNEQHAEPDVVGTPTKDGLKCNTEMASLKSVELEETTTAQVQTNLSTRDIKVIKLEEEAEAAREKQQEHVAKIERDYCNNRRCMQRDVVKKCVFEGGSAKRSNNNQSARMEVKNVVWPQRKPYNKLFNAKISEHPPKTKPHALNVALKTPQFDAKNKRNAIEIIENQKNSQEQESRNKLAPSSTSAGANNPWINVSNRKKRRANVSSAQEQRGRDVEEYHDVDVPSIELRVREKNDDGFERYDVAELVDVVVSAPAISRVIGGGDVNEVVVEEKESLAEDAVEIKQNKASHNKNIIKNKQMIKRVMVVDNINAIAPKEITPAKKTNEDNKVKRAAAETPPKPSNKTRAKKHQMRATVQLKGDSSTPPPTGNYNIIPSNSENKTNVEVSQELDMLIQRGMYSILEEKIRSFNITASNDGFFKTINYYGPGKLMSADMTNSAGNKDLRDILKDLKQPALTGSTTFDVGKMNVPKDALGANINSGYQGFLGLGPDPHEPDKDNTPMPDSSAALPDNRSMRGDEMTYPITRAVKEWMTKSKEHTPDIELLKSPTTIWRQFTAAAAAATTTTLDDDMMHEVILWTLSGEQDGSVEAADQADLLDCWQTDDDLVERVAESARIDGGGGDKEEGFIGVELKMGQGRELVVDEDDVLEVYESRYGRNEDFVRIREQWSKSGKGAREENGNRHRTVGVPPTASLPYRAICCAVM